MFGSEENVNQCSEERRGNDVQGYNNPFGLYFARWFSVTTAQGSN